MIEEKINCPSCYYQWVNKVELIDKSYDTLTAKLKEAEAEIERRKIGASLVNAGIEILKNKLTRKDEALKVARECLKSECYCHEYAEDKCDICDTIAKLDELEGEK